MASITLQIGDDVLEKMIEDAATCGLPVDTYVAEILEKYMNGSAHGLIRFFARADREGWKADGPLLTDDEMYTR